MSNFNSVTNEELLAVEGGNKVLFEILKEAGKALVGWVVTTAVPTVFAPLNMIEQYRKTQK